MAKKISGERKTAYYVGMTVMVVGGLMFLSVFITAAINFGDFNNFESDARSSLFRAIGGMVLIIVGGIIRGVGAAGLAGSGVVLDPEQARSELEPYSRMAGGMLKDAIDESGIKTGRTAEPEKIIMIKCRACGKLNEEDSKFCQECGQEL